MLGVGVLACVADAAGVIATSECSHCMACRVCLVGLAGDEICTSSSKDLCHRFRGFKDRCKISASDRNRVYGNFYFIKI